MALTDKGDNTIYFRDVRKQFGPLQVLAGINLEVRRGEVVVFIGPSGSGKTTLLRCVAGLESCEAGEIIVFGRRVTSTWKLKGQVGFVFQQFNLFPNRTALGNVTLALRFVKKLPRAQANEIGLRMLETVGLREKAGSFPAKLSGGQQQRVAIARSLAMQPEVILFDEPTSALDRELVGEVLSTIKKLADAGMTMLIVTHELRFAEEVADRIVFMDHGSIVEQGKPAQVLHHSTELRTAQFLGLIEPGLKDDVGTIQ